jgi:hypothetical protein
VQSVDLWGPPPVSLAKQQSKKNVKTSNNQTPRQKSLHTVVFTNDLLNTNKQTNTFIKEKVFVAL